VVAGHDKFKCNRHKAPKLIAILSPSKLYFMKIRHWSFTMSYFLNPNYKISFAR
jgi:hypothetical protein